jgi:hypothetical protein
MGKTKTRKSLLILIDHPSWFTRNRAVEWGQAYSLEYQYQPYDLIPQAHELIKEFQKGSSLKEAIYSRLFTIFSRCPRISRKPFRRAI